jgi:hypothetical protein
MAVTADGVQHQAAVEKSLRAKQAQFNIVQKVRINIGYIESEAEEKYRQRCTELESLSNQKGKGGKDSDKIDSRIQKLSAASKQAGALIRASFQRQITSTWRPLTSCAKSIQFG